MKKFLALLGSVAAVPVFAEGGAASSALDTILGKVETEVGNWNDAITGFFGDNFTTIVTIVGVALGVTVLWCVFKLFTKGAKKIG